MAARAWPAPTGFPKGQKLKFKQSSSNTQMHTPVPLAFSLCILAVLTAAAQSPEPGVVQGRVINSRDGQPLALVQVVLQETSFRAITSDDGTFKIPGVPPGKYVLQASVVGYQLSRQEFTLAASEAHTVEIVLTSSTAQRTDT